MLKSILAIIVSYVAMFAIFMAIFTCLYFVLGVERVFQPDSYEVSMLWIALTLVIGLLVSIFAGFLCAAISKSWRTCQVFALIVFVLAMIQCFGALRRNNPDAPNIRAGEVGMFDAMSLAVTPLWLHFVNPILGGAGVLIGARMKRRDAA
jgi:Co/Zn/Cd efflux system component